jgi:hypothetical protein
MPLFIGNGRSGDSSNWSFHAFILSTGLVSIGAQVFLFWMIVTKSPKTMHNFRFPLCMLTVG